MGQEYPQLNERQSAVFTALLQEYVTTARAVGSRTLARRLDLELSPATIRNVMADLEDMGLLRHRHTSSGRIPTTLGYGYYVDGLMRRVELSESEKRSITQALEQIRAAGVSEMLDRAGEALARTSALISVVLSPDLAGGVLHKIDLVRIATGRLLMVLSIRSGFVRSILLEISSTLDDREIENAARLLNERLSGLTLEEIRSSIGERLRGLRAGGEPVIRLVMDSAEEIFTPQRTGELRVEGKANVLEHPEFADVQRSRAVIELLEDRDVILHLLEHGVHTTEEGARIAIGEELGAEQLSECSVVTAQYSFGDTEGTVGIIGPSRMDYPRLVSLVSFAAGELKRRMVD